MIEIKNGEWNFFPCGGAVLLDAEGKPRRLSDGGLALDGWTVQHEAEVLLGAWIDVGEWSDPAPREDDATAPCSLSEEQPTHKITFTDGRGEKTIDPVFLHDDGAAYTHDEWDAEAPASWGVVDGVWLCHGQATPGGQNGTVEVETLGDRS